MAVTYIPTPKELRDLLVDLLGREVTLNPSAAYAPALAEPAGLAVYVDDAGTPTALIVSDLHFSVYAGAAIGLVPPASAETAIEAGDMNDVLRENFYEVMNIAASLFNVGDDHIHVKLGQMHHAAAGGMDPQHRVMTFTLGRRDDYSVEIDGYGRGLLSILLLR